MVVSVSVMFSLSETHAKVSLRCCSTHAVSSPPATHCRLTLLVVASVAASRGAGQSLVHSPSKRMSGTMLMTFLLE